MGFLLLGIDSFIVCLAISPIIEPHWRWRLAALFGVADAVGFMVGAGLGLQIAAGASAAAETTLLVLMGLWLIAVAAGTKHAGTRWSLWAIPWVLTIDNLAFGLVGDHSAGSLLSQATEQALSSALMGVAGIVVATGLSRVTQRAIPTRLAGVALIVAAGALLLV
jgi:disulfide bond formation protein DsbB